MKHMPLVLQQAFRTEYLERQMSKVTNIRITMSSSTKLMNMQDLTQLRYPI